MKKKFLWIFLLIVILTIPCKAEEAWTMPESIDCGSYTIQVALKHIPQSPTTISRKEAATAGCTQDPREIYDLSVLFTPEELERSSIYQCSFAGDKAVTMASPLDNNGGGGFRVENGDLTASTPLGDAISATTMYDNTLTCHELDWMSEAEVIQELRDICGAFGIHVGNVCFLRAYDHNADSEQWMENAFKEYQPLLADCPSFYLVRAQVIAGDLPLTTFSNWLDDGKRTYMSGYVSYIRSESRIESLEATKSVYQDIRSVGKPMVCTPFEKALSYYQRICQQLIPDFEKNYTLVGAYVSYMPIWTKGQRSNAEQLLPVWTFITRVSGPDYTSYQYRMLDAETGMPVMDLYDSWVYETYD